MNKNAISLTTRVASLKELEQLLKWAAAEGWNPGIDDLTLFHDTDPTGFFVSFVDNQLVAGVSVLKHSSRQAFLGLHLCKLQFHGQGIGIATGNAALASAGNRTTGLDGVADQQDNYRKSGFVYHFGNLRYCGLLNFSQTTSGNQYPDMHINIRPASPADREAIVEYDSAIGNANPSALLSTRESRCF